MNGMDLFQKTRKKECTQYFRNSTMSNNSNHCSDDDDDDDDGDYIPESLRGIVKEAEHILNQELDSLFWNDDRSSIIPSPKAVVPTTPNAIMEDEDQEKDGRNNDIIIFHRRLLAAQDYQDNNDQHHNYGWLLEDAGNNNSPDVVISPFQTQQLLLQSVQEQQTSSAEGPAWRLVPINPPPPPPPAETSSKMSKTQKRRQRRNKRNKVAAQAPPPPVETTQQSSIIEKQLRLENEWLMMRLSSELQDDTNNRETETLRCLELAEAANRSLQGELEEAQCRISELEQPQIIKEKQQTIAAQILVWKQKNSEIESCRQELEEVNASLQVENIKLNTSLSVLEAEKGDIISRMALVEKEKEEYYAAKISLQDVIMEVRHKVSTLVEAKTGLEIKLKENIQIDQQLADLEDFMDKIESRNRESSEANQCLQLENSYLLQRLAILEAKKTKVDTRMQSQMIDLPGVVSDIASHHQKLEKASALLQDENSMLKDPLPPLELDTAGLESRLESQLSDYQEKNNRVVSRCQELEEISTSLQGESPEIWNLHQDFYALEEEKAALKSQIEKSSRKSLKERGGKESYESFSPYDPPLSPMTQSDFGSWNEENSVSGEDTAALQFEAKVPGKLINPLPETIKLNLEVPPQNLKALSLKKRDDLATTLGDWFVHDKDITTRATTRENQVQLSLEEALKDLEALRAENAAAHGAISVLEAEKTKLESQIASLRKEPISMRKEVKSLQSDYNEVILFNAKAFAQISQLQKEKDIAVLEGEQALGKVSKDLVTLNIEKEKLESKIKHLKSAYCAVDSRRRNLEEVNDALQEEILNLQGLRKKTSALSPSSQGAFSPTRRTRSFLTEMMSSLEGTHDKDASKRTNFSFDIIQSRDESETSTDGVNEAFQDAKGSFQTQIRDMNDELSA